MSQTGFHLLGVGIIGVYHKVQKERSLKQPKERGIFPLKNKK
jgi:hypothetical protein